MTSYNPCWKVSRPAESDDETIGFFAAIVRLPTAELCTDKAKSVGERLLCRQRVQDPVVTLQLSVAAGVHNSIYLMATEYCQPALDCQLTTGAEPAGRHHWQLAELSQRCRGVDGVQMP